MHIYCLQHNYRHRENCPRPLILPHGRGKGSATDLTPRHSSTHLSISCRDPSTLEAVLQQCGQEKQESQNRRPSIIRLFSNHIQASCLSRNEVHTEARLGIITQKPRTKNEERTQQEREDAGGSSCSHRSSSAAFPNPKVAT